MNKTIGTIFMLIPLILAFVCFALGLTIWMFETPEERMLPAMVLFFLGSICMALFCTASVIIPQLLNSFSGFKKYFFPILGYLFAAATFVAGIYSITRLHAANEHVAGHIICGLALITACVSTVATASVKFKLIPENSQQPESYRPQHGFGKGSAGVLKALPILFACVAWVWTVVLLIKGIHDLPSRIAGFVFVGLSSICTGLIGLVWSIVNQIENTYQHKEKRIWAYLVVIMGLISLILGIVVLLTTKNAAMLAPGWVLVGLGMICFSISSKIILLAVVWKSSYTYANRIPMIPIFTALICLFIAAFLFVLVPFNGGCYVPARVLVGLGCICFCLFSIVSILESGTSAKK